MSIQDFKYQFYKQKEVFVKHPLFLGKDINYNYEQNIFSYSNFHQYNVQNQDYQQTLTLLEEKAFFYSKDPDFKKAFLEARKDPESIFYSKTPVDLSKIEKVTYQIFKSHIDQVEEFNHKQFLLKTLKWNFDALDSFYKSRTSESIIAELNNKEPQNKCRNYRILHENEYKKPVLVTKQTQLQDLMNYKDREKDLRSSEIIFDDQIEQQYNQGNRPECQEILSLDLGQKSPKQIRRKLEKVITKKTPLQVKQYQYTSKNSIYCNMDDILAASIKSYIKK